MCGINGLFNYSGARLDAPGNLVERMNYEIRHRGPDGNGIWSARDPGVYFGHQRLSILDLTDNGRQPMEGHNRTVIVFNGEIYNYRELKADLAEIEFHTGTDTEVLLALYEKQGLDCLSELNGMFAFAIWDQNRRKLVLARDRLGIKPLYYTVVNGIFAFSSEIKALLTLPWIKARLDEDALYDFLTFNRVSPPNTIFEGIHKLKPGHRMVVGSDGIELNEAFWEVSYDDVVQLDEEATCEMLLEKLEHAVKYRLVSDVPVGGFLSGGVDSSAIVALMARNSLGPVKTYSIGFENAADYDERHQAELIARKFDTDHYEKIVTPDDLKEFLPRIVDIYDEPLADATSIPMCFLSELARDKGTIVVQTGDGADELFCGYRNWMRYAKLFPYYRLFMKLPVALRKGISRVYSSHAPDTPFGELLVRGARGQELFWGGAGGFKESTKQSIMSDDYAGRMESRDSHQQVMQYRTMFNDIVKSKAAGDDIGWMTYLGMKYIVPNFYLYRADRMGMANSIELRVPFLDHNLVQFAMSIPSGLKIKRGEPKYILKKSLEGILPCDTLYRKKQGFCVPLNEWAGNVMIDYIERNRKQFCADTGLFNEQGIKTQVDATRAGRKEYVFALWNIYFLMIWFRRWML